MQTLHNILRAAWAVVSASLYKLAFAPLAVAGFVLVPLAIVFGVTRESRIVPGLTIFTAPDWLGIYGNEQEGYDSPFALSLYKGWPTFWRRYAWAAWRNKIRNVPFVPSLAWLHRPKGQLVWREARIFGALVIVRWRGWMTELLWAKGSQFGDIGPRLDQPTEWGAVSWAFRVYGRS